MILTCPACETRYLVDDSLIGDAGGRRVRCASCAYVWRCTAEAAAIQEAIAQATAAAYAARATTEAVPSVAPIVRALRPEPTTGEQPYHAQNVAAQRGAPPPIAIALPTVMSRRRGYFRRFGLIIIAIAIVLGIGLSGDRIITIWPAAAPFYAMLHLIEQSDDDGLALTIDPMLIGSDGSLLIKGDIVNNAALARRLPRLRVILRDGKGNELDSKVISPPIIILTPGMTTHFSTTFRNPTSIVTLVVVTFATP